MDEKILLDFFEKGKLLTPEALRLIKNNYEYRYTKDMVVTHEHLEKLKIINMVEAGEAVTTNDLVVQINKKYEKMKALISARIPKNFVSISNLQQKKDVFVIGIVRDIEGARIELEDPTGTIHTHIKTSELELDDVVAISGFFDGDKILNASIMLPDVPIRAPYKAHGKVCIATGLDFTKAPESYAEKFFDWFSQNEAKTLIALGKVKTNEAIAKTFGRKCHGKTMVFVKNEYPSKQNKTLHPNIISASNPCIIDINGAKIMVVSDFNINNLRKRQLKQPKMPCEPLIIETVPDIVVYNNPCEPQVVNYKSITMVNTGSLMANFRPVAINLGTREAVQAAVNF